MPPPDIYANMLSMCDPDDDAIHDMMLVEEGTRSSAQLRDLYSLTLKANYMKCKGCLERHVARQDISIYLEVLFQTVMDMMKDCEKLCKKCYQYAIHLQVSDIVPKSYNVLQVDLCFRHHLQNDVVFNSLLINFVFPQGGNSAGGNGFEMYLTFLN
jgi:hypothetical protein